MDLPTDPEVADRWRRAVELRRAGLTYQRIADELGWKSISSAYDAVQGALRASIVEPAATVRALELERLDALLAGLWELARNGQTDAIDRVLKVMDRRAKLLGLDAATKHAVGPLEHLSDDALIARVAALDMAGLGMTEG